jgi:DNA polymerase-3 subunit delta'
VSLHPLVGHEDVRRTILGAVARESLPSALLVHGPKGVGKQRLALWIGQLLMCNSPTDSGPCDRCGPCKMGLNLEHPDLNWYFPLLRPKGASGERLVGALEDARMEAMADLRAEPLHSTHFDELRGLYLGMVRNLRRRATMRPTMAEGQIFVIGNAELLVPQESSPEAANALLKLLEEPPGAARFILTTSEPGRMWPRSGRS